MFEARRPTTRSRSALNILELIYHSIVRNIRSSHRNALVGLILNMLQAMILVAAFYTMFTILGVRKIAIRGDFLVYIMTGIFMYITHIKAVGAVAGSEGPTSAMMLHAPMNTIIAIASSALSSLYIQVLSLSTVLYLYHAILEPITIHQPIGAFAMLLVAWFTGVAAGVVFLAIKPWAPEVVSVIQLIYMRANMIASGKMFVANTLPSSMLVMFDWNPLFHAIDQARGFAFINYNPHFSSIEYPLKVGVTLLMIGLMLEFYTRRRVSTSWAAGK
ncbi:ABC transporter permease [Pseudooctadecabacter jejudonensis]|uniref:ABC-2 type transporter n=1 Tax=Pseudooctadecabacter jejudonensis TaxID=1391910 RepID=A0A1Y5SBE6_9RHOB|nr:ABC transporter permease [Pseudooctadecabacter jejudonensis]SLN34165.1 ABC-2 type transporter [Pseudooctadecabacter jejudonensis]